MTSSALNGAPTRGELESLVVGTVYRHGTSVLAGLDEQVRNQLTGEWRQAFDAAVVLARRGEVGPGSIAPGLAAEEVQRHGGDADRVRVAIEAAQAVATDLADEEASPLASIRSAVQQLHALSRSGQSVPLDDLARPLSVEMLLAARHRELLPLADLPLRHGLGEDLDRAVGGGLMPGDVVAIGAAGAGAGKTALAMQIADGLALRSEELARSGEPGVLTPMLIVSELSPEELAFRTVARAATVPHAILLAGQSAERVFGAEEVGRAFASAEQLLRGPLAPLPRWQLVIRPHEDRDAFMQQIASTMKALKERTARTYPKRTIWPVLVVDPIQRWQAPGLSEVEALNQLSEDLDAAADRDGWIVLLTSDTNKSSTNPENGDPGASVFRGSMKLLHAADVALILEAGKPSDDPGKPRPASLQVFKSRRGPAGAVVSLSWLSARGLRFEPAARPEVVKVDQAARIALLRALVERETAKGTELTPRKLRGYLEELHCAEKKLPRLVDEAIAAGAIVSVQTSGRGGRQTVLKPASAAPQAEHWSETR